MAWDNKVANAACQLIERHEGRRNKPYKDTVGKLTIGVGFNLDDVGLLDDEIDVILRMRLGKLWAVLSTKLPYFNSLVLARQIVLLDMAFNLGIEGLLKFKQTLAAVAAGSYSVAADRMLDSKWAVQVGGRATRLATMMETGELL